ncbi:MAG: tungsten formylmethanofuran dehydrogenase [Hyphomicrobiales bacterium]|nr:tungsten formylmethanofuran dehydrogenase [Hyphomicrobiales bacterium]
MPGRRGEGRHARAWIEGVGCPLDAAIDAVLDHLRRSRNPLFAGLGCDVEGARAIVRLAKLVDASIDHLSGTATGVELSAVRDAGLFATTPGETFARADTLLVLATERSGAAEPLLKGFLATKPRLALARTRRIIWVGRGPAPRAVSKHVDFTSVAVAPSQISPLLSALRSRLARRPVGAAPLSPRRLEATLEKLREAKFGVAIWPSRVLDPLTVETLTGLVRDLNESTRFSCLPVLSQDNAAGVAMALTWLTGFPSHIGFSRGEPEHDPWRFDAARLVRSGEADLAFWVSAYRRHWPPWSSRVPVIALVAPSHGVGTPRARVEIEVGTPGVDHDTIDLLAATGSLAFRPAAVRNGTPSVADVIGRICAGLSAAGRAAG